MNFVWAWTAMNSQSVSLVGDAHPTCAMSVSPPQAQVVEALAAIRSQWQGTPRVAIVLGTGLGRLAEQIEAEAAIPYAKIPHFPRSTALAHAGRLVCGRLEGVPLVAMQGRSHLYEGYTSEQIALPIRVMAALGAGVLIASNASGGMNPRYRGGDVMVLEDHINLMGSRPSLFHATTERVTAAIYDPELIEAAMEVARRKNFVAHQGVYVAVSGPNYETRAEYRMFHKLGGDCVGMSTVPEALVAYDSGMRVLALSIITNVATPDAPQVVDAQEVVNEAMHSEPHVREIVRQVVRRVG
jgi:purine-nucleoside phosphorylase